MPTLSVTHQCTCGCHTIGLVGDTCLRVPNPPATRFIVDALGNSSGATVGIMLSHAGGMLAELEIYAFGDSPNPFPLPNLATLRRFDDQTATER